MAEYHVKGILKHRRDTSSNWTTKNPIILDGEIILVDTSAGDIRIKVGDGTKHYSELPFLDEKINVGTAYRALITDASGRLSTSSVTSTELGYISGVTSAVQTQLDNKVPSSRTINKKALTSNITLSASDVGAQPKITVNGIVQGDGSGNLSVVETVEAETIELDAAAVGLGNVDNVKQYSASNPPPYPVASVNGKTGAVTVRELPTVTVSDDGKVATVDGGTWTVKPTTSYLPFTGAAAQTAGTAGLVPAPTAGQQGKYLRGDGTWANAAEPFYVTCTVSDKDVYDMDAAHDKTYAEILAAWQAGRPCYAVLKLADGDADTSVLLPLTELTDLGIVGGDAKFALTEMTWGDVSEELQLCYVWIDSAGGAEAFWGTRYTLSGNEAFLPDVAVADNGKFLRVVKGSWVAATVPSAGGVSF